MRNLRTTILPLTLSLLICGCNANRPAVTNESTLVTIAKQYAQQNGLLAGKPKEVRFSQDDQSALVWLSDNPRQVGNYVIIEVSKDGKVIKWIPGR